VKKFHCSSVEEPSFISSLGRYIFSVLAGAGAGWPVVAGWPVDVEERHVVAQRGGLVNVILHLVGARGHLARQHVDQALLHSR
jgi:hypothetical protein